MAVGLKIAYPDTLFVSSVQIDELHNAFTSMLNQMALLDDTETRLQVRDHLPQPVWPDDGRLPDEDAPRKPAAFAVQAGPGPALLEKLQAGELRRYSCYLFVGIEPIVEFSERIKRRSQERTPGILDRRAFPLSSRHVGAVDGGGRAYDGGRMEHRRQRPVQIRSTDHVHLESRRHPGHAHAFRRLDRDALLVVQSQVLHAGHAAARHRSAQSKADHQLFRAVTRWR